MEKKEHRKRRQGISTILHRRSCCHHRRRTGIHQTSTHRLTHWEISTTFSTSTNGRNFHNSSNIVKNLFKFRQHDKKFQQSSSSCHNGANISKILQSSSHCRKLSTMPKFSPVSRSSNYALRRHWIEVSRSRKTLCSHFPTWSRKECARSPILAMWRISSISQSSAMLNRLSWDMLLVKSITISWGMPYRSSSRAKSMMRSLKSNPTRESRSVSYTHLTLPTNREV